MLNRVLYVTYRVSGARLVEAEAGEEDEDALGDAP